MRRQWFHSGVTKVIKGVPGQHSDVRKEQNEGFVPVTESG